MKLRYGASILQSETGITVKARYVPVFLIRVSFSFNTIRMEMMYTGIMPQVTAEPLLGNCPGCGKTIKEGESVFVVRGRRPESPSVICYNCARKAEDLFAFSRKRRRQQPLVSK